MAQDDSNDDLVVLMDAVSKEDDRPESWHLDTGCSNHMIGNVLMLRLPLTQNITFQTKISATEVQCLRVVMEHKLSWLWHLRTGHLTFRSLNQLVTQEIETSLPKFSMLEKMCEGCLLGKQSKNSLVSSTY